MFKKDKYVHAFFGIFIACTTTVIAHDNGYTLLMSAAIGAVAALLAGILKEALDEWMPKTGIKFIDNIFKQTGWSWLDIGATEIGGLCGGGLGLLIIIILG